MLGKFVGEWNVETVLGGETFKSVAVVKWSDDQRCLIVSAKSKTVNHHFSPADAEFEVPTVVPRGADIGAIQFAAETIQNAPIFCTLGGGVTGDSVVSCGLDSRADRK
jgi:hypothetical protein